MLDPGDPLSVVSWQVRSDGLYVWRDAELIAVIGHVHMEYQHVTTDSPRASRCPMARGEQLVVIAASWLGGSHLHFIQHVTYVLEEELISR